MSGVVARRGGQVPVPLAALVPVPLAAPVSVLEVPVLSHGRHAGDRGAEVDALRCKRH